MKRGSYARGVAFASVAAGPAFLASLALAMWASEPSATLGWMKNIEDAAYVPALVFMATLFGFGLSLLPNLVGTWFVHGLAIGNAAFRLPVAWALVGAGAAGLPFVFLPLGPSGTEPVAFAFTLTGASCALVAWRFTIWT